MSLREADLRDALYALVNSPGWTALREAMLARRDYAVQDLVHEKPQQDRAVNAAFVRALDWVAAWPQQSLDKLGVEE